MKVDFVHNTNFGGFSAVKKRVLSIVGNIRVGVFSDSPNYPNGASLVDVARKNAFGTARIPARNFMRAWAKKMRVPYTQVMLSLARNVIRGNFGPEKARRNLGIRSVKDLQQVIENFSQPPNAPYTIAQKGFNNPLIHTRHLKKNIRWKHGR